MPEKYYLGIDLGGTNIKAGIVSNDTTVKSNVNMVTERGSGPDGVIRRMCQAGEQAIREAGLRESDLQAIGIGAPGTLNHETGIIIAPPNLPDWRNIPIRDRISSYFKIPAVLENDANAAAWAEYWAGAGRDAESIVMLTLGTGIGGGIILGGHIHRGFNDTAAEIGHMIVQANGRPCACGQRGCLETYASAMNMAQITIEKLEEGRESSMKELLEKGQAITSKVIEDHMIRGDALACEIWEQTCKYLAIGCINIANVINPEMIVFSGGMAKAGDRVLVPFRKYFVENRSYVFEGVVPELAVSELENDAGFIGAAGAAKLACDVGEIS